MFHGLGLRKVDGKGGNTGFCNLFEGNQVWRLPDGSTVEDGTFGVGKGPGSSIDHSIQADDALDSLFGEFPKAPIDTPEHLSTLWVAPTAGPVMVWKRDGSVFFSQFRIPQILSSMMCRRGLFVTPELARRGAPAPDGPTDRSVTFRKLVEDQ